MVERDLAKVEMWVRFPSPAPDLKTGLIGRFFNSIGSYGRGESKPTPARPVDEKRAWRASAGAAGREGAHGSARKSGIPIARSINLRPSIPDGHCFYSGRWEYSLWGSSLPLAGRPLTRQFFFLCFGDSVI